MHLAELLARRPVPAAAVFLALTRRCPLHCRHCSTMSERTSEQQPAARLRRFVASFTPADHPEFVLLTGGEPLLRPGLVRALAGTARAAGTRSYLLTGAFFAGAGKTAASIQAALQAVDHVAVSTDVFHEAEVPRAQLFRVLHEILAAGRDASIQACGTGPADPYLADLTQQVRAEFGERVPMLVTTVQPAGRARSWLAARPGAPAALSAAAAGRAAAPCDLAAWPVVGFDGTITACCNTDVLQAGPMAGHLRLGHVGATTWPQLRRAVLSSPVLRGLRTRGPLQLARAFPAPAAGREPGPAAAGREPGPAAGSSPAATGYCGTCRSLSARPQVLRGVQAQAARPAAALIEQQVTALQLAAGPAGFARRHGDPSRADLVLLGYRGPAGGAA